MPGRSLLISLRPRFARAIYSGDKRFELRRTRPKGPFDRVFIYETTPVGAITGFFSVTSVRLRNKRHVWAEIGDALSLQKSEFDDYLKGRELAVTIGVGDPVRFAHPVPLHEALEPAEPPQSFRFLKAGEVSRILGLGFGSSNGHRSRQVKISEWRADDAANAPG